MGRRGRRPVQRLMKSFQEFDTRAGRLSGPYDVCLSRFFIGCRGRLSWRPVHRIPAILSINAVGAAALGGPPSYAIISELLGNFVQRPNTWEIRWYGGKFVGRRGRRPVQRLMKSFQEFDTRAGRLSGPYDVCLSRFFIGCRGRLSWRPVHRIPAILSINAVGAASLGGPFAELLGNFVQHTRRGRTLAGPTHRRIAPDPLRIS